MRYGPTGTEFVVTSYQAVNHTHIRVRTVPGVGALLLFSVRVAGQSSSLPPTPTACVVDASTGVAPCVSYAPPVILSLAPSTAPTLSSPRVAATITGTDFGLRDRAVDVTVVFGNAADGTQRSVVPTSWSPRWQDGASTGPHPHSLTFAVPEGLGASRAVFLELRHSGTGALLTSNAVLFDYAPPALLFVELRPLDETFLATLDFVPAEASSMVMTIHGSNFGPPANVRVGHSGMGVGGGVCMGGAGGGGWVWGRLLLLLLLLLLLWGFAGPCRRMARCFCACVFVCAGAWVRAASSGWGEAGSAAGVCERVGRGQRRVLVQPAPTGVLEPHQDRAAHRPALRASQSRSHGKDGRVRA